MDANIGFDPNVLSGAGSFVTGVGPIVALVLGLFLVAWFIDLGVNAIVGRYGGGGGAGSSGRRGIGGSSVVMGGSRGISYRSLEKRAIDRGTPRVEQESLRKNQRIRSKTAFDHPFGGVEGARYGAGKKVPGTESDS